VPNVKVSHASTLVSIAQQVMCYAEAIMWDQEILGKCVCQTFHSDELLQPRQPFLAALQSLSLLHQGQSQDARPILAMKQARKKGEADLERVYYPCMLQIFQVRAVYLKKRKDYTFRRQFNEKPSIIPGCPGIERC